MWWFLLALTLSFLPQIQVPPPIPFAKRPRVIPVTQLKHCLLHASSPSSSDPTSEYKGIRPDTGSSSSGRASVIPSRRLAQELDVAAGEESRSVKVQRRYHTGDIKSCVKPKISDFPEKVTSTLQLACSYYRVFIATQNGFPLKLDQDQYSREAWQLAAHEYDTAFTTTPDVYRVVRSLPIKYFDLWSFSLLIYRSDSVGVSYVETSNVWFTPLSNHTMNSLPVINEANKTK